MYYKDRNGVHVPYQERDMGYDITQGYLQKEGGGLPSSRGVHYVGSRWVLARGGRAGLG